MNSTAAVNVHIDRAAGADHRPRRRRRDAREPDRGDVSVGIWTTASRRKARVLGPSGGAGVETGPYVQVSRLGNPLFNEVLVPLAQKDYWNAPAARRTTSSSLAGVGAPRARGLC